MMIFLQQKYIQDAKYEKVQIDDVIAQQTHLNEVQRMQSCAI